MPVETDKSREQYDTNGTTGPWAVRFYFFDADELLVIYTDADGATTTLANTSGFTATGAGDEQGGSLSTTVAYPAGGTITILQNVAALQPTRFRDTDRFPAAALNRGLDRLTLLAQRVLENLGRALTVPPSESGVQLPSRAARKNKSLAFNDSGDPVVLVPVSGSAAEVLIQIASSIGTSFVGFIQAGAGAVSRTVQDLLRESATVTNFGADRLGVVDSATAFANAWTASKYITIPHGTYKVSSLPNFGVNGARIKCQGKVRINYTGTGNGLTFDAGATPGTKVYDIDCDDLEIVGTASATNGIFIRGVTHSRFGRLRAKHFPAANMRCEFMVSNHFKGYTSSGNEGGLTVASVNGLVLEKRGTDEQCSNNQWDAIVIEGMTGDGIYAPEAAANTFLSGTSEGNGFGGGAGGVWLGPNSFGNTFIGLDMEFNGKTGDATSYHVKDYGLRNHFVTPFLDAQLSDLFWSAGGNSGHITGGQIGALKVDSGVKNFLTMGMAHTGTITDNGTDSRHIQRYNVVGATTTVDSLIQTGAWVATATSLGSTGTVTLAGMYQKIGRQVHFSLKVTSTGSTTCTAGTTTFSVPFPVSVDGNCLASDASNGTGLGTGGVAVVQQIYPPAWTTKNNVVISGDYFAVS